MKRTPSNGRTGGPAPRPGAPLAPDSLGYALAGAAGVIGEVIGGRNLNEALERCWRARPALPASSRGAIQDLSYSALRDYGRGDFLLTRLLRAPLPDAQARGLLLAALHRLEARPDEAHTTVDQAVEAAAVHAHGKFKALTNAVLRNYLRQRGALDAAAALDEQARWRHPSWWLARLRAAYPSDWQALAAAGNMRPPMALRVNRRRVGSDQYAARLDAAGIKATQLDGGALLLERPLPVERLPGFADGWVSVQDAGAQLAAPLLDLADGLRVLDACAAPGGKTAHMLESASLELLALDADATRAERIHGNLARLGLTAAIRVADCRDLGAWWDGRPFDRVLADVPCSASGVVRRHPDIKWLRRDADIAQFACQQAEILEALWRVVAPGGKLLYATCSLFPEENGRGVAAFAARQEDCLRLPVQGNPELQLLPTDTHDGFFYALLQKRA